MKHCVYDKSFTRWLHHLDLLCRVAVCTFTFTYLWYRAEGHVYDTDQCWRTSGDFGDVIHVCYRVFLHDSLHAESWLPRTARAPRSTQPWTASDTRRLPWRQPAGRAWLRDAQGWHGTKSVLLTTTTTTSSSLLLLAGTKIANGIGSGFVSANQKHGINRFLCANVVPTSWPYIQALLGVCPVNNAVPRKIPGCGMQFAQDFETKNSRF